MTTKPTTNIFLNYNYYTKRIRECFILAVSVLNRSYEYIVLKLYEMFLNIFFNLKTRLYVTYSCFTNSINFTVIIAYAYISLFPMVLFEYLINYTMCFNMRFFIASYCIKGKFDPPIPFTIISIS